MQIAVLDLGTNTFNLLIAESVDDNTYKILVNVKEGVKLGEGGINNKIITEAAMQRGITAVGRHFERISAYQADKVVAFATSAIRDAANSKKFTDVLKEQFNLELSVISGDQEAELIYLGVRQTLPFKDKRFMILDIGGGSNELIIADHEKIYWKHSFNLGMARLLEKFTPSDPITPREISAVEEYLGKELTELMEQVRLLEPEVMIGASGSFDTFVALLASKKLIGHTDGCVFHEISLDLFHQLYTMLVKSTREEREKMRIEPVRRDMIVLASIFVNFVLKQTGLKTLYQSAYSLKEGAVFQILKNNS